MASEVCRIPASLHATGHLLPAQLLAHLYAKTDAASLAALRRELLRPPYTAMEAAAGAAAGVAVVAGAASWPITGFGSS